MLRDLVRRDNGLAVVRHTGVFGKKQPYEPTQRNNDGRELAEQFVSQQALEQVRLRFLGLAKGTHDPRALGDSSGIHRHLRGLLALDNVHKALRRIFADLAERARIVRPFSQPEEPKANLFKRLLTDELLSKLAAVIVALGGLVRLFFAKHAGVPDDS